MFDIGWSELLVIGALALIVVGPKELPVMLRTLGRYVGKARGMARDFQRTMEDAAREADLHELRDVQKSMTDFNRKIGGDAPRKYAERFLSGDDAKKKSGGKPEPEPGSLDAADAAENEAWEREQAAKRAEAERVARIDRDAAALEAEAAAEEKPASPGPKDPGGAADDDAPPPRAARS